MGWTGAVLGALAGRILFGGALGTLFGAVCGHEIEKHSNKPKRASSKKSDVDSDSAERALVFCASASAMFAKMAKADGSISQREIAVVERCFARLGFAAETRRYAIQAFRRAKQDGHDIREYAQDFARVVQSVEIRELLYELLWDLACADGEPVEAEVRILRDLPSALSIRSEWYSLFARQRLGARRSGGGARTNRDELAEAYATLGVEPSASDDEVRRAYREKAKKCHPDVLRSQGLPDEMIGRATEKMAQINAAWATIRSHRGL